MLTSLLIYYGGCAVGLWGIAKYVEHLPDSPNSGGGGSVSPYGDDMGPDGEPLGMPYMP